MNRRITLTVLASLIGLCSTVASADKGNPPPAAKSNPVPPAQAPKLPVGSLPLETPKVPPAQTLGGQTADRTHQLEEDGLQPGPKGGKAGSGAVTRVVSDRVVKTGSKISGGWREYAADQSWRRAVFILDREAVTIIFSDGKPGRRPPSMTHYMKYAKPGPGTKGSPASYHEVRTFADASPAILDKANQSSLIPADVATRIHELGGDIKLMQQMAELKRIGELKNAFDAMRNPGADGGFFPGRPGGSPGEGNWSNPRRGVGRDGRASDDDSVPEATIILHDDGSTTTTTHDNDNHGNRRTESVDNDKHGNRTGGSSYSESPNGDRTTISYTRDPRTDTTTSHVHNDYGDGRRSRNHVEVYRHGRRVRSPSEVPFSGRGGFNEEELARSRAGSRLLDTYYLQWKRENDLRLSGGRIKQPGRGDQPSLVQNEGPEVGTSGVVNCGDSNTNPCARAAGASTDTRRSFGTISQPGRGVGSGGATPGTPTGPRPPVPEPEPQ